MNFQRKIELAQQSIRMISQADDVDAEVRSAALDRMDAFVIAERKAIAERVAAKIEAQIGSAVEVAP